MSCSLANRKCVPCEGGMKALENSQIQAFLKDLHEDWKVLEDKKIRRKWVTKDFVSGIAFFEQIKEVAEAEGHHPDLHLTSWNNVEVDLWTHSIGGLSENDFIVAAKIDKLSPKLKAIKKPSS